MKKFLSMLISFVMILSLIPSGALAVQTYALSEEGVAFIKEFEGFRDMPYEDRGKWYVGYGTVCDPMDYLYPIAEMEADWLLRQALADKVERVNKFLMDYNITMTQQQFDALVSLTYNLGSQWINPEYRLCSYLINGIYNYSEAEIVNAIATWCHQGQSVLHHLTQRRLREAYLFLYGLYQSDVCDRYTYIHFDPNGGEVENKTVFYPVGYFYGQLPVPEWNGHLFLGWFTQEGVPFTGMEIADEPVYITAVWDGGSLQQPEQPGQPEQPKQPAEPSGLAGTDGSESDLNTWVNPYKDVVEEDWYYTYVQELSAKGIVNGYPEDGTFRPAKEVTAGEALKLILLAAGYPEQKPTDVSHWASGYLTLAESLGCVRRGELADLNAPISRMSIAKITAVALGLGERYGVSPFADAESGYLLALYEEGIVEGSIIGRQRYFYPNDGIIRAEVCAIISRVNNWEYKEKNDPSRSGYIEYRDQRYPVLSGVAVSTYDKNLFVKNGSRMYYNDYAYTTALGIDVSSYQGEIDWQKVAADGIEFAMIRLGYRGYSEGEIFLDKYFQQNLQGAKAAGLKVGVYFFSQAITAQEAQEEALFVVQNLAGARLDYPVVYDWEPIDSNSARTMGLAQNVLTDCAIAFCETVEMMGYTPMVYYNLPVGYSRYDLTRLTEYDVWYAQYAKKPTMYYDYRIWQYTDSGEVDGIEVKVDMNLAFIPY